MNADLTRLRDVIADLRIHAKGVESGYDNIGARHLLDWADALDEALPSLLAIAEAYAGAPEGEVAVSRHEGGAAVYVTRFNPAEVFKLAGKRVRLVRVPE